MLRYDKCRLRLIEESDLGLILSWRNSKHIRSVMYTNHVIQIDEHKAWFERVTNAESTLTLLFEYRGNPLGIVNINKIDNDKKECVWGFYIGDKNAPKGSGSAMGFFALEYIFNNLTQQKVIGEALEHNDASVTYHQRLGFINKGRTEKCISRVGGEVSIISFELSVERWRERKREIASKIFSGCCSNMNILLLGPHYSDIGGYIESEGDSVVSYEDPINAESQIINEIDFIVSYGYRHIIKEDVINLFQNRIINLHISYLPFNRGTDPNLWSFLEDTPKGVTIHMIDKGINTGDIIVQKEIILNNDITLKSSYEILSKEIRALFMDNWNHIKNNSIETTAQPLGGTYHKLKDKKAYQHFMTNGWDTPVNQLIGIALQKANR